MPSGSEAATPKTHSGISFIMTSTDYFKYLGKDLSAGLVVFLVALPLCLGIALGSNPVGQTNLVPPFAGLIAGIAGGLVVGSLSGSQLSVSGPAAGLTAIVAASLVKLPSFEAFLLSVFIAGLLQIAMGYAKLGVIGNYVPTAVIKAMLTAIGILLILKQVPHLVGYDKDFEGDLAFQNKDGGNTFTDLFASLERFTGLAAIIGITGLAIQLFWDKVMVKRFAWAGLVPAPMLVVVAGVLMNQFALAEGFTSRLEAEHMVNIPIAQSVQQFASFFSLPDFSALGRFQVWLSAATIALVASLETLLNLEASDALDPHKRISPTNRELKAQGVGNAVSGLLGGLPVTSVVVRTSANINAGARTKMAAVVHGLLLLLCVAFLARYLNFIPLAALASVLVYIGYKLAKPSLFTSMYRMGLDQFVPFMVTIVAIILTDLLIGILVGMVVALFFVLRSNFHSAVVMVNDENKYLLRLRKDVSYLNKPIVRQKLADLADGSSLIIDATRADFIDKDVIYVINEFMSNAAERNISVELRKAQFQPRHKMLGQTPDAAMSH